jgi:hypothetical protein
MRGRALSQPKAKPKQGGATAVRTTYIDLPALDGLEGDALGLFCWSDVRPLAGVAGYVDWRLCGALSATLLNNYFQGLVGESLLIPVTGRMGSRRLFMFGLGSVHAWDSSVLRQGCKRAYDVMRRAGAVSVLLGAPAWRGDKQIESTFVKAVREELGNQIDQVLLEKV